ncbi:terminase, partial [Veillonella parvula]|uniref:terminase n=1 Tax=Veillonella parvula TaxID=29466 RepID=UPI0031B568C5
SKNSPESFAGLHNQGNRILVLFDEASAIDDVIWEVTEGALTDANTEIIWCAFGNPTRNSGRFRECFRKYRKFWNTYQIDSRTVKISNKAKIEEWLEAYGEDSDFFKVRVRGVFPSASDLQFISTEIADKAQKQVYKPGQFEHLPVIIGVDPAWTGSDSLEIVMRQGYYMKSLASIPKNDDDWRMAQLIAQFEDEYKADAVFIDMGYGTGIYSIGKQLGRKWRLIEFGGKSNDPVYLNMRAYMWGQMKEWLREGGSIPPNDQALYDDIVGPEAIIDKNGHIQLESKKDMKDRGLPSPNKGDALALTFAARVVKKSETGNRIVANTSYNPF